jgi:aminoglycoside phosphotransferase (APT) family kinase protein
VTVGVAPRTGGGAWQDPAAVARWLIDSGVNVRGEVKIQRVGIGQSNITSVVADGAGSSWVLREPPAGAGGTAHDMSREMRMLDALAGSGVPVPRVVARGTSAEGRGFYAMTRLPGQVLESEDDAAALAVGERARIAESVADVLAGLHAIDPRAVGLDSLVSRTPYVVRQLRRCEELWQRVGERSRHHPRWRDLRVRLEVSVPPRTGLSIVHGDYRLSNLLVADGQVTGVLDWELAAVGEPLADVAWLLDDWREPAEPAIVMPSPTRAGGFGTRTDLIRRYELASGRRLANLDYYRAFTQWRAATLLQGVIARRRSGVMGDQGAIDVRDLDDAIGRLLASSAGQLGTHGSTGSAQ